MLSNLYLISSIQAERRRQAEYDAAQWRLIRSLRSAHQTQRAKRGQWFRVDWLARFRERQTVRARLREYAAG